MVGRRGCNSARCDMSAWNPIDSVIIQMLLLFYCLNFQPKACLYELWCHMGTHPKQMHPLLWEVDGGCAADHAGTAGGDTAWTRS